jgi:hypothetical protein
MATGRISLGFGLCTVLLAAACGNATTPASPQGSFDAALTRLQSGNAFAMVIKSDISARAVAAIGRAQHQPAPPQVVPLLTNSQISIAEAAPGGQTLAQLAKSGTLPNLSVSVALGGTDYLDIRGNAGTVYLRVDVPGLEHLAGSKATGALPSLPPAAAKLPFVAALLSGKWVSLSVAQLKLIESQMGGSAGVPSVSPQQAQALRSKLLRVLQDDVKVSGGTGCQYTLTTNTRTFVQGYLGVLESAVPSLGSKLGSSTANIPSRQVTMSATVSGGVLQKIVIDLAQFVPAKDKAQLGGAQLPIELDFADTAPAITFPSGAVPVNLSQIFGMLMQQQGQSSSAAA